MNGRRRKGSSAHILLIGNNQYPILRHVRPSSHRDVLFIGIISLPPTQIVDGGRALKATLSFNWALALIELICLGVKERRLVMQGRRGPPPPRRS